MKKIIRHFLIFIMVFGLLLAASFFLFKKQIIEYLSVNQPVDAEYLIVEGWMSDHSLDFAATEFRSNNYSKLIVTGVKMKPWYLMPVEGFFEFGLPREEIFLQKGDSIKLKLRGTAVNGIYSEYSMFFNGKKAGSGSTRESWEEYVYIADTTFLLQSFAVSFDNDAIFGEQDRNLFVGALTIHDMVIPARSENSLFYEKNDTEKKHASRVDFSSVAEMATWVLREKGIKGEDILTLTAERSDINKTYNSALRVKKWLESESISRTSFNIVSENIHARRSWLLFRYALRNNKHKVGIITESKRDKNQNIKINNLSIWKEIAGNLYYRTIFRLFE